MTELVYLADMPSAYLRTFDARVTALPPGAVVLDRTLFYAAGGGQPCDRGTLTAEDGTTIPVVDVVKSGASVLHRTGRGGGGPNLSLRVGGAVQGTLDWGRRHRHMRLHTAQHLVSAVLFETGGLKTRRATMSGVTGIIDLEAAWPTDRPWSRIEARVREFTESAREVRVVQVPRAQWEAAPAARSGLVPLPLGLEQVRVIQIDGIDECPCGGTHVRSTGEIGPIELPTPTGTRVELRIPSDAPSTPTG